MNPMRCLIAAVIVACGVFAVVNAKEEPQPAKVLRHVVLFKFKEGVAKEQIQEVVTEFQKLPKKIDVIQDFEWGTDVSVENRSQGFTHAFLVSFKDEKGRDTYLPHPAHKEFVELALPRLEDALVVDYWAKR